MQNVMNSVFSEQILADKLSKLNSTQQCIETLSHWCIFHRSKAELVVDTWDKQFRSSQMIQKVPLLYLANDILQNSKRKGNEFVIQFWKVLPLALKDIAEKGDDRGKNVVSRLVTIWEERKVFGSRVQSLRDVMLGEDAPPPLEFNKKRSRSVRIVKRDTRSIRTKLSIGSCAERIVSAFHLVVSEYPNEEAEMTGCQAAVQNIRKMETDAVLACSSGTDPRRKILAKELEEEEDHLKQCIEKLRLVEASRAALVSQLKEALREQESELENVRTQMQVGQAQAEEARKMRSHLCDENYLSKLDAAAFDASSKSEQVPKRTAAIIAAEVADKLTASSSSQLIMHSVLSTFAAEEAKNLGLAQPSSSTSMEFFQTFPGNPAAMSSSRSETSLPISDASFMTMPQLPLNNSSTVGSYPSCLLPQPSMMNPSSVHPNPSSTSFMQPSAGMLSQYGGYGGVSPMPPAPPLPPPYMVSPMVPLSQQSPQLAPMQALPRAQQQQQSMPLLNQTPGANLQPLQAPGILYYGVPPHA